MSMPSTTTTTTEHPTPREAALAPAVAPSRDWAMLVGLILAYAAVFAAYAPPCPGIEDEIGYLNQALVWSRGAVTAEGAGFGELVGFYPVGGVQVSVRQPGRSLIMLPFLLAGGVKLALYSGLLVHAATVLVGGAVLSRLGHSPLWAALLLFHPTLAIYSRTLMADEGAGLGLLIAALGVVSLGSPRAGFVAGLGVAFGAVSRYHTGLALPAVTAAFLLPPWRSRPDARRQAAICLITGALGGALLVAYNLWLFRHPTDPTPTTRGSWSLAFIPYQAKFFAAALMTVWPGMLLAPLLDRSALRWAARGIAGTFLAMFLVYYWHDTGSTWIETMVLGLRLIQVALPVWIACYAAVVADWVGAPLAARLRPATARGFALAGCVLLLVGTTAMFARHQAHLQRLLAARAAVAAVVPDGARLASHGNIEKLFGTAGEHPSYQRLLLTELAAGRVAPNDLMEAPWYVAVLPKTPDDPALADARAAAARFGLTPVATPYPGLVVLSYRPAGRGARP